MPDIPTVEMSIQVPSPQIVLEVDAKEPHSPGGCVLVPIEFENTSTSQMQIMGAYGSKQFTFPDYVPDGYKCIGYRYATISNYTGGSPVASCGSSSTVTFRNISSTACKSGGSRTEHGTTIHFYKVKVTLICIEE